MLLGILYISALSAVVTSTYHVQVQKECDCACPNDLLTDLSLCQKLTRFEKELYTFKRELEKRTHHIQEIWDLKERMELQEDLVEDLMKQIVDLRKEKIHPSLPKPELLVMEPEDQMMGDSGAGARKRDADVELAQNVSNLLAKVEVVENLTSKVQEELVSERRVRRHLEEDLNATRSSIKILDDKLHNVTSPMDDRVEELVISTLENMNKTLFDEHIQKLYYRVDGVVYRNETRKLDERLNHVEAELLDVDNSSTVLKFKEELRALTDSLNALNETIAEKIAMEESRLEALEENAIDLEEIDALNEKLATLLNASDLVQSGVEDLWHDIQDIRNYTANMKKELTDQLSQKDNVTQVLGLEISQQLENLSEELSNLRWDISKREETVAALQKDIQLLTAEVAANEHKVEEFSVRSENKLKDVYIKLNAMSQTWNDSLETLTKYIVEGKNSELDDQTYWTLSSDFQPTTEDIIGDVSLDPNEYVPTSEEIEEIPCSLPTIDDEHLLVTIDNETGQQQLKFSCQPIGRYFLNPNPIPFRCVSGEWYGSFPSCIRLLDETEVEAVEEELKKREPCSNYTGDLPDPVDCSRFFKCWHGISQRMRCPRSLHFDKLAKRCDYVYVADCVPSSTPETELVENLTPVILVDPDNVDKPYGLMGTGQNGHMIAYPRTSFSLKCVFPENRWGSVTWHVDHFKPRNAKLSTRIEKNTVTLTVTSAANEDSGVYTCRTPFGRNHSITVDVQAVTCPDIEMDSRTFFRPHPEGEYRILSTTVQFLCKDGTTISAICQANGKWSRTPPSIEECPPKTPKVETLWGCPSIGTNLDPNLVLEREDRDKTITFKCAGNMKLSGNNYIRCYAGSWTHSKIPICVPRVS